MQIEYSNQRLSGRSYDPAVLKECKACENYAGYTNEWIHCQVLGDIRPGTARFCRRKRPIK